MAFIRCGWFIWLAALPLGAGTIEVSSAPTATLHAGDALTFGVADWNFAVQAAHFGLPQYPTHIGFTFVSAPVNETGQFIAILGSNDGSVEVAFDAPLSFIPGSFQGAFYRGPVSTLQASMTLSGTLSQQLFAGPGAVLILRNAGPDVVLGLPPYTLREDLSVSLIGGGLSVGGPRGAVRLDDPPESAGTETPEPGSGSLLLAGAVLLCAATGVWKRRSHQRIPQGWAPQRHESADCNPIRHSDTI